MNEPLHVDHLTVELVRSVIEYDPETGLFRWKVRRANNQLRGWFTGWMANGYSQIRLFGRAYQAHRVAWFMTHNEWPDQIDHKNGKKRDNRLINLRNASPSQNANNVPRLGYTLNKSSGRYQARIRLNGNRIFLGEYDTPEEAHHVYVRAHAEAHGDYSFTNRLESHSNPQMRP